LNQEGGNQVHKGEKEMQKLTTTIKREWLKEIVAKRKRIEYREIKDYWEERLNGLKTPFLLRLINGMSKMAPEVTVEVIQVVRNDREGEFELHLGKIIEVKNWDTRLERAKAS
jgi:hypothetical protein